MSVEGALDATRLAIDAAIHAVADGNRRLAEAVALKLKGDGGERPSLREIQRRTGIPKSTISDAADRVNRAVELAGRENL
jgi:hypothetical protein